MEPDDEWGQYRYALPTLKRSLSTIYLRPEYNNFQAPKSESDKPSDDLIPPKSHGLELPFYARYLLIAAYIASYNPKSVDKRFFVKVSVSICVSLNSHLYAHLIDFHVLEYRQNVI